MLEFLKNLKNSTPIITPDVQRQQANLDALNAVSAFQDLVRNDAGNAGFSPQSVDLIRKIGADKVADGIGQGLNNGVPEIADWINQYNNGAGRNNPLGQVAEQPAQDGQILQGGVNQKSDLKTNLSNAWSDFQRGYKENVKNGFQPANLFNQQFSETVTRPSEQLVNYQNQLREQGIDENIINAVAEGKNSGNKDIANWIAQNPDALNPVTETIGRDKTIMGRLGEGLGTLARVADKPLVKSLLVGGLVGATGGSPADMLNYGVKTGSIAQQAQLRNDLYRQKLKQLGYSDAELDTIKGYVGDDIYKTISDGVYKENMADYRNMMAQIAQDKADTDAMYKSGSLGIKQGLLDVAKQNAATNARRANIYQQIANQGGRSGYVEGGKNSGSKNPMYGKHLAEYNAILQSGDENKIKYAQNKFIETYGEDPNRALKSENDILKLLEYLGNE